ncbi:MAG TPA: sterol desaturase family protein [Anaeromyxobacter sp.]
MPPRYSPVAQLAAITLGSLAVIWVSLRLASPPSARDLAGVAVFLVLGNALEWHLHRDLLHRRTRPLQILYVRHTPQHHALYVPDDLAIHGPRELRFVLLPAYAVFLLLAVAAPIPIALAWIGERNLALFFVATAAAYLLAYEWLHLVWHLPAESAVGRLAVVRRLRRHHALHHTPQLKSRWNFNVTFPLWDLVRGTYWRPARATAHPALARRAAP